MFSQDKPAKAIVSALRINTKLYRICTAFPVFCSEIFETDKKVIPKYISVILANKGYFACVRYNK